MKTRVRSTLTTLNHWSFERAMICGAVLLSFAAGTFVTLHVTRAAEAADDANRIFELEIYHAVPGKVPALVTRFSDAAKLQAKHNLNVIGYWVPDDQSNTFIYLLAHHSR